MKKLYEIILIIIPMLAGSILYLFLDKKYTFTEKISSSMKMDKKWQLLFVFCNGIIFMILIDIINAPRWIGFFVMGITINGIAIKIKYGNNEPTIE